MSCVNLEYAFLQHFYIANKNIYETILCECINQSEFMIKRAGGRFSLITDQESGQPDVVADNTGYELDFKMMISQTLKRFQSITAPVIEEIAPGVKSYSLPPQQKEEVVLLWNSCRNMTEERLHQIKTQNDKESNAVIHFFEKVLTTNKNILLFMPVYFTTIDKTLTGDEQFDTIFDEISSTLSFVHDFRQKHCSDFDTFLIYLINIPQQQRFDFVIAEFKPQGLGFIDRIPMFTLPTVRQLARENSPF